MKTTSRTRRARNRYRSISATRSIFAGERTQTDFQFDKDARTISETFSIRLVNRSAHEQTVAVREHLYRWTQWSITQSSAKYEKRNADTVEFKIPVPANGDTKLTYTAQYKWNESYK